MKKMMALITALMMIFVLVACGGTSAPAFPSDVENTPESVTKAMIESSYTGKSDVTRAVSCAAAQARLDAFTNTDAMFEGVEVDFSNLTYTASAVTDTTAIVTVQGFLTLTLGGESTTMNFDGLSDISVYPLVKEGDFWKACKLSSD